MEGNNIELTRGTVLERQSKQRQSMIIGTPSNNGMCTFRHANSRQFAIEAAVGFKQILWTAVVSVGTTLAMARNIIVSRMFQTNSDYIFWLDADVIPNTDTLSKLLAVDFPIVSAVYISRQSPNYIQAKKGDYSVPPELVMPYVDKQKRKDIEIAPLSLTTTGTDKQEQEKKERREEEKGLVMLDVEEIGLGACLVQRRVFETMAEQMNMWFCLRDHRQDGIEGRGDGTFDNRKAKELGWRCPMDGELLIAKFFRWTLGDDPYDGCSEDVYWSRYARGLGFPIFLMLDNIVDHEITSMTIGAEGLVNRADEAAVKTHYQIVEQKVQPTVELTK